MVDVFTRTGSGWALSATIGVPDDFEFFPQAISMSNDTIVVTSPDSSLAFNGVAYVFSLQDGTWVRQATLTEDDNASFGATFGTSVSIRGNLIAVGAASAPGATQQSGAVYVYARRDDGWAQIAKLVASDGADGDAFGFSVSVFGNSIGIGAPGHNANGSVYVDRAQGDRFSEVSQFAASDGVPGGFFGFAVAIHDDTLLVGAMGQHPQIDNGQGYPGGEAYVDTLRN
jgi:FG-GAP repeat protein